MSIRKTIQTGVVLIAAVAVALVLAACGNTIDNADLEGKLADDLSADAGVDPAEVSVACPEDEEAEQGNGFDCTLTAPNGDAVTVEVTLTDDEGGFEAVVPPQQFEDGQGGTQAG